MMGTCLSYYLSHIGIVFIIICHYKCLIPIKYFIGVFVPFNMYHTKVFPTYMGKVHKVVLLP